MTDTYVVELNQNMASWSKPGEYEVQLATPIEINEGDQLSFRMASLDSNITDQDTILITSDQVLTGVFSYYEVNYNGTDKVSVGVGGGLGVVEDYKYYAAYNDIQLVQVTAINLVIIGYQQGEPNPSAGDPIPGSFVVGTNGVGSAVDNTVNFSATFNDIDINGAVQQPVFTGSNTAVTNYYGETVYYASPGDGTLTLQVTPFVMRVNSLKFAGVDGFWPGARSDAVSKRVTFGTGANVPRTSLNEAEYDDSYSYFMSDFELGTVTTVPYGSSTGNVLDKQTFSVTLKAGRYDPQSLAVQLTQLFSAANGIKGKTFGGDQVYVPNNPLLTRTDDPINANMIFNQIPLTRVTTPIVFQNGQTYKYFNPAAPAVIPAYFVGTTQFAIEYATGAGDVFVNTYNHMPMSDPARPGEQDLALYTNGVAGTGGLEYNLVTAASGIAFHDLQPVLFWQTQLGLRQHMLVPLLKDANGLEYYTKPSLLNCVTYGFQGLGSFLLPPTENPGSNPTTYPDFRKMSPIQPVDNPIYLNCTGQSRSIVGDTVTVNRIGGYFLIEILNVFRNGGGYIDNEQNRRQISAVVSTQMDSNNAITGYQDSDSIGYVHRGSSYLISSAVVRILNPLTKVPVISLGNNNTVWFQVQKQIQQMLSVAPTKKRPIIKRRDDVNYSKIARELEAQASLSKPRAPPEVPDAKEEVKPEVEAKVASTKIKPQITLKPKPKQVEEPAAAPAVLQVKAKVKPLITLKVRPVGETVTQLREDVPPELK
jgi:hypothetical protein